MLAGGGSDHNKDLRQKHHGIDGDPSGAPSNLGRPIEIAQDNGAALEHDKDGAYWLVGDVRHARRYLRTFAIDPKNNKAMKDAGIMVKADTLAELAAQLDMDPARLKESIHRFNGFARAGVDGTSAAATQPTTATTAIRRSTPTPASARSRRARSPRSRW